MGELQVRVYFAFWIPNKIAWFLEVLLLALPLGMASQINVTQINGTVGQSVLLPCVLPPPPPPLTVTRVYWQTVVPDGGVPDVLHFFNKGSPELVQQALQYQNRTVMDPGQLAAGNFSLKLKNMTESDNQTIISCLYSTEDVSTDEVFRYILMLEKPVATDPDPHSLPAWAVVLVALACILLVCVAVYIVRRWKNANRRANREREKADEEANHLTENANGAANHVTENANGGANHETENGATSGREREEGVNGLLLESHT